MPLSSKFGYTGTTFRSSETFRPKGQSPNSLLEPPQQSNNPFADPPPVYQQGQANYNPGSSYSSGPLAYAPNNTSPSFTTQGGAPLPPPVPVPGGQVAAGPAAADDPYAFLSNFDTVFIIDDSASMQGSRWKEVSNTLASITPICTARDADGIDIHFLNHKGIYTHVNDVYAVQSIFNHIIPSGSTPTGTCLYNILNPYIQALQQQQQQEKSKKPLNIIVITDGAATDDPESVIFDAAKKLDAIQAPPWQVGIQFFQVGDDQEAAELLRELDDALVDLGCKRDMVDTVPNNPNNNRLGTTLNADMILKTVLGGVHRRFDRKKAT